MFAFPDNSETEIENFLEKLKEEKIRIVGVNNLLSEIHNNHAGSIDEGACKTKVSKRQYKKFVKGKSACPVWFLIRFLKEFGHSKFVKEIPQMDVYFTARKALVKLPSKISPKLAYYFGYLQGDGYLSSDKRRVGFIDEYEEQIKFITGLAFDLFGIKPKVRTKMTKLSLKPHFYTCIKSLVLNSYFNREFGLCRGIKKGLRVPEKIKESKTILPFYLAGLFDADGTLPKNPEKAKQLFIDITLKDKKFIKEIMSLLFSLGISTLKPYCRVAKLPSSKGFSKTWELRIRKKGEIKKFIDTVSFIHPIKRARAIKLQKILDP